MADFVLKCQQGHVVATDMYLVSADALSEARVRLVYYATDLRAMASDALREQRYIMWERLALEIGETEEAYAGLFEPATGIKYRHDPNMFGVPTADGVL